MTRCPQAKQTASPTFGPASFEQLRPGRSSSSDRQATAGGGLAARLCQRAGNRRLAVWPDTDAIPAATTEPALLREVHLDLPAEPDRPAAELRDRQREVCVLLAAKRDR